MSAAVVDLSVFRARLQARHLEARAGAAHLIARERALANGLAPELAERIANSAAEAVRINGLSAGAVLARRGRRPASRRPDGPEAA